MLKETRDGVYICIASRSRERLAGVGVVVVDEAKEVKLQGCCGALNRD